MARKHGYAPTLPEVVGYAWSSDTLRRLFPERFAPVFISGAVGLALGLSGIGGGRGFVAERDVAAGELLLVERPLHERLGTIAEDAASLAEMCRSDDEIAAAVRVMHPVGESLHVGRLQTVWRLSAFESGLYPYQSLFNDSYDAPCIQLHIAEEGVDHVWCTRPISKGEPLTLSYVQPVDASAERRAWVLQHHGFLGEPSSLQTGTDVEAALDWIEETDDSVHDILEAALDAVNAACTTHESPPVRRRAWGVLARVADRQPLSASSIALHPSLHAKLVTWFDGEVSNCLSSSILFDLVALKASLRWLYDLDHDPKRGPHHPDVAQAAAIGAGALDRVRSFLRVVALSSIWLCSL